MKTRPYPVAEIRATDRYGRSLTVRFEKNGDRYSHTIFVEEARGSRRLLDSLEGDNNQLWPPSPPLQDLSNCSIESDVNSGHVTMLAGAAGTTNWAMTVTPRYRKIGPGVGNSQAELFFDVACRVRETPKWLGSSYKIVAGQSAFSKMLNLVRAPVDPPGCLIVPETSLLHFESCTGPFPIVRCQADIPPSESPAETIRWRYAIRLIERIEQ